MICFLKSIGKYIFDNFYWIIPTAATLIMIYYVKKTSKEQIENAANDTIKQVNSQIKEQHRPFLTINHLNKVDNLTEGYLLIKTKEKDKNITDNKTQYLKINMKNIGYGVATKIKFYGVPDGFIASEYSSNDPRNESILSTLCVGVGDSFDINIIVPSDASIKSFKFIYFYEDLNNNNYPAYLFIDSLQNAKAQYTLYPDNSSHFSAMIRKLNIDYDTLLKNYKENN